MTTSKSKIADVGPAVEEAATTSTKSADLPVTSLTDGAQAAATNLKEGIARATAGVEATRADVTEKMKEGVEKALKTTEDLVAFNQGNMEALVKSGQIWATGLQDLSKHLVAAAQASLEEGISTFKALTSVKSLKDAFELQSSFARSALEKSLAESGKLTDASLKLTEQALAPITARVSIAAEKFSKAA